MTLLTTSTVATYQTLNNPDRLKKFDPKHFKLVIVDEAHHAAAISSVCVLILLTGPDIYGCCITSMIRSRSLSPPAQYQSERM